MSTIIKFELRGRLRAAFAFGTSATLHVCVWHISDMPRRAYDVR